MEGYTRKEDGSPQLLDLIPREREWLAKRAADEKSHGLSGERKLELSLGPPTGDWTIVTDDKNNKASSQNAPHESLHYSFGYFQTPAALKPSLPWQQQQQQQMKTPSFLHLQSVMNEPSQPCNNRVEQGAADQKKGFSAAPANINTAVPNSQKRTAPSPVVGWPPIRSFRKNLASGNSSKLSSESPDADPGKDSGSKPAENGSSRPFVKINMDGIPIGRKIDLKAYHSYEKLSYAVDELFRDLLAAQSESCVGETKDRENGGKGIGGLLDGSGEYTLVYEDNEGDRMLVGDVPWHMFVATVKRLRVLKSSELPKLSRGSKLGGKLCS